MISLPFPTTMYAIHSLVPLFRFESEPQPFGAPRRLVPHTTDCDEPGEARPLVVPSLFEAYHAERADDDAFSPDLTGFLLGEVA